MYQYTTSLEQVNKHVFMNNLATIHITFKLQHQECDINCVMAATGLISVPLYAWCGCIESTVKSLCQNLSDGPFKRNLKRHIDPNYCKSFNYTLYYCQSHINIKFSWISCSAHQQIQVTAN